MRSQSLDCRNLPTTQAGRAILDAYNGAENGDEFSVLVDSLGAGLRMWLIEAGVKHRYHKEDAGGWQLTICRGLSPGKARYQGSPSRWGRRFHQRLGL